MRKKPTALKRAQNNPGKRPLPTDEPSPKGVARCPSWLPDDAKAIWKRLAPQLIEVGCLTPVDGWAFSRLCQMQARWRDGVATLTDEGSIVDGKTNPLVKIVRDLDGSLLKLEAAFGLSPQARCSIHVAPKRDDGEPSIENFAAQKPRLVKDNR